MSRLAVFAAFLLFVIQAQAQTFSHGIPAGATSPEADGRQHGIPSNVQSPTPIPAGIHPNRTFNARGPLRRFGKPRDRKLIVPVPVFYPIYGWGDAGYPADPYVQPPADSSTDSAAANPTPSSQDTDAAAADDALRQAYLQGARDALKDSLGRDREQSRYGDHYTDSREQRRSAPKEVASNQPSPEPKVDDTPATVFIFKDGHQVETKNFAIMGQTLYDFSGSTLKKVQLGDLDKDATTKANDDRGITVKLP